MEQITIPVITPEGIQLVRPRIGWNAIFTARDKLRWANLYVHLLAKGHLAEKAEIQAFQQVWQMRDYHLQY
jgi:hypothetical protein